MNRCRAQDKYSFYGCVAQPREADRSRLAQGFSQPGAIRLQKKQYKAFLQKQALRGAWVLQHQTIKM